MPSVSQAQHNAMEAAAHGHSTLGIPEKVGKEFVAADDFNESDHPRDADGKFGSGGGSKKTLGELTPEERKDPNHPLVKEHLANLRAKAEKFGSFGHTVKEVTPSGYEPGSPTDEQKTVEHRKAEEAIRQAKTRLHDKNLHPAERKKIEESIILNQYRVREEEKKAAEREARKDSYGLETELDIAKAIQSGQLDSPQRYENIHLFDVRITGTGTAYRPAHEEIVYRPPENFLTPEFVERCNGLPLVFEHPDGSVLTTEEFRNRSIGTVILPYIKGDEVWGIAKVFDADAAALMQTTHASTSPAVVFRDAGSTETVDVDGQAVLIEGKPSYLDHLAICKVGVWDKGGEPSGVNTGDPEMDTNDQAPAWADALIKRVDAVCARMDSMDKTRSDESEETARKAAEELEARKKEEDAKAKADADEKAKADAARKDESEEDKKKREEAEAKERADAEEKEAEEKAKADAARADSVEIQTLRNQVAALTRPLSSVDREALAQAQSRADGLAQMFGKEVSAPLFGESPIAYRKRLAAMFQPYSAKFKEAKLDSFDGAAFDLIEEKIYTDAAEAARTPDHAPQGSLIPVTRKDSAGREITSYPSGDPLVWMAPFMMPSGVARFIPRERE